MLIVKIMEKTVQEVDQIFKWFSFLLLKTSLSLQEKLKMYVLLFFLQPLRASGGGPPLFLHIDFIL